jgi:hypothetical protein
MAPIDDGHAVHYSALQRGIPVYSKDEQVVGKVVQVLDNYREHIMDGIVIETPAGRRHFVDAPEVARTAELAVTLTIGADEIESLPPPPQGQSPAGGLFSKLFGGRGRR